MELESVIRLEATKLLAKAKEKVDAARLQSSTGNTDSDSVPKQPAAVELEPVPKVEQKATVQGEISPRELTPAGKQILASVAAGGIPLYINNRFKAALAENGVHYRTDMAPNEAVEALQTIERDWDKKQASGATDAIDAQEAQEIRRGSKRNQKRQEPKSEPEPVLEAERTEQVNSAESFEEKLEAKKAAAAVEPEPVPVTTTSEVEASNNADLEALNNRETLRFIEKGVKGGVIYTVKKTGNDEYALESSNGSHTVNEILLRKQIEEDWTRLEDEKKESDKEATPEPVAPEASVSKETGTTEEKIAALKKVVEEARKAYVQEDYEYTNKWLKIKNFFRGIKQEKSADTEYYQAEYNNALIDLHNAELAKIKQTAPNGLAMKKEVTGLLEYYKMDELINLRKDRTQVKVEHQGWSGKVMGTFEAIGRKYNKLTRTERIATSATLFGLAGATGGASLIAGRFFSSAGTFVGMDVLFEKLADRKAEKRAKEDVEKEEETWRENRQQGQFAEADFDHFSKLLQDDIFALDKKLQDQKRNALFRKALAAAMAAGVAFGLPRWLFNEFGGRELAGAAAGFVMRDMGGQAVVDLAKEHLGNILGEVKVAHPNIPATGVPGTIQPVAPGTSVRRGIVISPLSHGGIPEVAPGADSVVAPDAKIGSTLPSPAVEQTPVPSTPLLDGSIARFEDILNDPYQVKSGDSIWKIFGVRVENFEVPQKTHFIDALKDKLADLSPEQLQKMGIQSGNIDDIRITDKIDFSQHLTSEDIQKAFTDAQELSPEKIASIAANDAKIAEFTTANPNVQLTNESVDNILHGNVADAISGEPTAMTNVQELGGTTLGSDNADVISKGADVKGTFVDNPDVVADAGGATAVTDVDENPVQTADIQYERDIRLGKAYDLKSYADYFKQYPEAFIQFKKIGETYTGFVFQGDRDSMNALGGRIFGELGGMKHNTPLWRFVEMARETYGSKFGLPNPKEKVYAYIARMAMLGMEHPEGKLIRVPQSI